MKQFITGAGLIGCYTAKQLIENGSKVILYDSNPSFQYIHHVVEKGDVIVEKGDIRDLNKLSRLLKKERPSCIIHTAAILRERIESDPVDGVSINVLGTAAIAQAAKLAGVPKIVFCSSLSVYDYSHKSNALIAEDFSLGPASIYDATKLSAEYILLNFAKTYNFTAIILRLASVYGYGQFKGGAWLGKQIQDILNILFKKKVVTIREEDFGINEYIYVKDVARAIEKACISENIGTDIFNIGSEELTSTQKLADVLRGIFSNSNINVVKTINSYSIPTFLRRTYPFNINKAKKYLRYEPKFDIKTGLIDYIKTYRARN